MPDFDFSETYLYKIRALLNTVDKAFDQTLTTYADITLSQFMVLMALSQHRGINQRKIARYLSLSAVAVKRQVDIAKNRFWVSVQAQEGRGEGLVLTPSGKAALEAGLKALEKHAFSMFNDHNLNANLMQHIDLLSNNAKEVIAKHNRQTEKPLSKEVSHANS